MKDEFYRPAVIEFEVSTDGTNIPKSFGSFEEWDDAVKFLGTNLTSINQPLTVNRFLDQKEKTSLRIEYQGILENLVPEFEKALSNAENELAAVKKKQKDALEAYNATINNARNLAYKVKKGLQEMNLDDKYTSRIAYKGRYYFFTYIDKELKLCKIKDIPEHEKTEIWNAMAGNEEFIDTNFGKTDEK
jgi:hypothetical protein